MWAPSHNKQPPGRENVWGSTKSFIMHICRWIGRRPTRIVIDRSHSPTTFGWRSVGTKCVWVVQEVHLAAGGAAVQCGEKKEMLPPEIAALEPLVRRAAGQRQARAADHSAFADAGRGGSRRARQHPAPLWGVRCATVTEATTPSVPQGWIRSWGDAGFARQWGMLVIPGKPKPRALSAGGLEKVRLKLTPSRRCHARQKAALPLNANVGSSDVGKIM